MIGTAGSDEKLKFVLKHGAVAAFNYKTDDFAQRVLEFTQETGVDAVLDCVGGTHAEKNIQVLKVDGRWIVFGLLGGINAPEGVLGAVLKKRLSIRGTTLRTRSIEYQSNLMDAFKKNAWDKKLELPVAKTFALDQVDQAHAFMKTNANIGKIVLTPVNS